METHKIGHHLRRSILDLWRCKRSEVDQLTSHNALNSFTRGSIQTAFCLHSATRRIETVQLFNTSNNARRFSLIPESNVLCGQQPDNGTPYYAFHRDPSLQFTEGLSEENAFLIKSTSKMLNMYEHLIYLNMRKITYINLRKIRLLLRDRLSFSTQIIRSTLFTLPMRSYVT